jgi:hypothetical protein
MPSTVIKQYNYFPELKILEITFVSGLIYEYLDVPEKTFKMLDVSGSKGRYFNRYIKDKFQFKKLEE